MSRRRALTLAAAAALAAPLAVAAPAPAGAAGQYTVTELKFTVPAGGRNCTVDADLYRPAGVDAAHPAPAVLSTNGFGGSKSDGSTAAVGKAFAERGYVALVYSGLGFGRSGCLISLDEPGIDGKAASGLVDFLAGERAADDGTKADYVTADGAGDPRVGMIGGSYGGAVQLATAAVDHRVDALVPMITWHDLAYSLDPNNAADRSVPGAAKWQWMNGFYLIGEGQPLLVPNLDPSRVNRLGCLHFVTKVCETIRTLNSGRYPADRTKALQEYARGVSPVSYLHKVKAPTLLVQGQADTLFNLNEAEATYRTLTAQGTPAKMIWQSWGHSGGVRDAASGELNLDEGNLETSYVGRRILAWFDRYLHKKQGVTTGPAFAYHRDWIGDPDRTYATASQVPPRNRTLYLSGDGKLVDSRAEVARGSREYRNRLVPTSHSESSLAGLIGLPDPAPYDTKGTYLDWTTEPLTEAMDVVGAPRATLKVFSPRTERVQHSGDAADKLVLFAKLYDVAPDGKKTLVHRLVSPVRVPDVTKPFTVSLPGIVHRYDKGHRLRFVVAASDGAYLGNKGVKPVTVTSAPQDTGVLDLPVVRHGRHR
ncbi:MULTISPECIES: CocE/NonD family hydrolase [Streptomyces]|uniref:CocE/NonD family hydrolase n=1 Tax=Streptomyces TaxID=1883 RepID=UPI001E55CA5D|nr:MULTISPECIES: CocE/NonD family hydrolase [Streptomyces]UFQ19170.1 CocE/NonD family hydrolase [Streptomyces huasconensis]WCL88790.1 CocE/NonD family hydrolase [Streptomyces sp. JCM 35825]